MIISVLKSLTILENSLACSFLINDNHCVGKITVIKQLDSLWKRALHVIKELWWCNSLSIFIHSVSSSACFLLNVILKKVTWFCRFINQIVIHETVVFVILINTFSRWSPWPCHWWYYVAQWTMMFECLD